MMEREPALAPASPPLTGESTHGGPPIGAGPESASPPATSTQPAIVTAAGRPAQQKESPKPIFPEAPDPWLVREKCDSIRFQLSLGKTLSQEEKSFRTQCK